MDLTVVGQTHPYPSSSKYLLSVTKPSFRRTLNRFVEFSRIYRKYLDQQIFYKLLLILILLEQHIIPRTRNIFIGRAPTYVCHFFHTFISLSIRPFARHVIIGTAYFSYEHIYEEIGRLEFFLPIGQKSANQKLIVVSDR